MFCGCCVSCRRQGIATSEVIPDTLNEQFLHEEMNRGEFRLIFSEERPGKYSSLLDGEYSLGLDVAIGKKQSDTKSRAIKKKKKTAKSNLGLVAKPSMYV